MSKQIKLTTPVTIPSGKKKISCDSRILTIGSCFSDNIGNRLADHYFDVLVNPFGTVFNPMSITKVLSSAIQGDRIDVSQLGNQADRYFHYDFHSSFDSVTPQEVADKINEALDQVSMYIAQVDFLILTFGTSIVYRLKSNEHIVSNCHKVPNYNFEKQFLYVEAMEEELKKFFELFRKINSKAQIILTTSPVRHTKEGLIENSLSKSRLIDLCHRLTDESGIFYFPAYEIMMDELRDYRYYKSDLIHPNDLAIDIIWSYFQNSCLDEKAKQKVQDIGQLIQAKNHSPFNPQSPEHQKFKKRQIEKINQLSKLYTEIDYKELIKFFED